MGLYPFAAFEMILFLNSLDNSIALHEMGLYPTSASETTTIFVYVGLAHHMLWCTFQETRKFINTEIS